MSSFFEKLFRKKTINTSNLETPLNRCLTTLDIILLGVGGMVGGGIYVLTGQVASRIAGPAIVLSFLLAGGASFLSALSFAEFGTWVPRAGSAYTYTYVTMGEIWAFVIGWNILLEHMIGGAAVARAWSAYLNSLTNNWIANTSLTYVRLPWAEETSMFSSYPDFFAGVIVLLICIFVASGAKSTTRFNHFFTVWNLLVIMFIVAYGLSFAQAKNWAEFFPFGPASILAGASRCFFAYIGFDGIATSAEEAMDPRTAIPRATMTAMAIVTFAYVAMSGTLTLMVPYNIIDPGAAFASAFFENGAGWAKYVVAVGAMSGITTALTGHLFALPRCVYAMGDDGLIFRFLAQVHPKTQVPSLAICLCGSFIAIVSMFVQLETLVDLLSIGTLLAYTLVSISVLMLRYKLPGEEMGGFVPCSDYTAVSENSSQISEYREVEGSTLSGSEIALKALREAEEKPHPYSVVGCVDKGTISSVSLYVLIVFLLAASVVLSLVIFYGDLRKGEIGSISLLVSSVVVIAFVILFLGWYRQNDVDLAFKVPWVPLLPALSIVINVVLMMSLSPYTWLRLAIWLFIGLFVYFGYGIFHSRENSSNGETIGLISPHEFD